VFEFSSDRKMMSIVVKRDSDGKILVFAKGADGSIFPRAKAGQTEALNLCTSTVDRFAKQGYRTLVFAMKELNLSEQQISNITANEVEKDF
jgi:phospholipid-translocating ATPase